MPNDRLIDAVVLPITVALFAIASASLSAGGTWGILIPDLTPIPVFYFALYRPRSTVILLPFILGLGADLLYGRPPGTGAIALVLFFEMSSIWSASRFRRRPVADLAALTIFGAAHATIIWFVCSLAIGKVPALGYILWQTIGCLVAFPFGYALLRYVFRIPATLVRTQS